MQPVVRLGYEEARDELIEVVQQLEQGGLDLDASLDFGKEAKNSLNAVRST